MYTYKFHIFLSINTNTTDSRSLLNAHKTHKKHNSYEAAVPHGNIIPQGLLLHSHSNDLMVLLNQVSQVYFEA